MKHKFHRDLTHNSVDYKKNEQLTFKNDVGNGCINKKQNIKHCLKHNMTIKAIN